MSAAAADTAVQPSLRLDGELTIYRAGELKPVILDAVRRAAEPAIDLSEISEIDTAGVQLLLLARREAASLDRQLALVAPSNAVREAFELLALPLDAAA
ncbi:STAS domain-containing protein [Aquincola tertiaricarbonis]|uniref:STAS domain-containing protein n=1 Tax=Aquincola tertiaricarbonis TaxID=391953 RepID=A0ABY4SGS0_AQUTE|nr:STAS domain-containing protein [Aquincola tertiaricarbonis]URI11709.1 STAS domain-containing protein [Aquincola tertiaricarbonis]